MNDLVGQIERMTQERDDLLQRARAIDEALDRVRAVLTPAESRRFATPSQHRLGPGQREAVIIDALKERQPQTIKELAQRLRVAENTIMVTALHMWKVGKLCRRKNEAPDMRCAYLYALDESVFGEAESDKAEADALNDKADEAG